MISLNLTTNNKEQERIKEYLENNVSENLADKINNGVKIVKDNKTLINKKDLNGFMKYACDEARKQADKGASSACVDDSVVFGWAIHYFEEDTIEGILYNEDGSEYKVKPTQNTTPNKPQPKKEEKLQPTFFDMLTEIKTDEIKEPEITKEEIQEPTTKNNLIIDTETGEVLTQNNPITQFDDIVTTSLFSLFENILEVK